MASIYLKISSAGFLGAGNIIWFRELIKIKEAVLPLRNEAYSRETVCCPSMSRTEGGRSVAGLLVTLCDNDGLPTSMERRVAVLT